MAEQIILASGSETRRKMMQDARIDFQTENARIDEQAIRNSLTAANVKPRDIADTIAEYKARKVAGRNPDTWVIGSDQILVFKEKIVSKITTVEEAEKLLWQLRNQTHQLLSSVVVYKDRQPQWRHVGVVKMTMREFSKPYLDEYLKRNWPAIRQAVGCYRIEGEGIRLFSRIDGDFFDVMGLPLLPLLSYLASQGAINA